MSPQLKEWKRFSQGREVVTVRFTPHEVWTKAFMIKDHREFIAKLFQEKGVEVTRWAHEYEGSTRDFKVKNWGLCYSSIDSDVVDMYEVHAIIGVNARRTGILDVETK